MKYLFGLLLSFNAYADDWFCTNESGKRDDNVIWSCGVGESTLEDQARKYALLHAIQEFNTICEVSIDCAGKPAAVEPKRMTCKEAKNGIWKCYRLIEVRIGK